MIVMRRVIFVLVGALLLVGGVTYVNKKGGMPSREDIFGKPRNLISKSEKLPLVQRAPELVGIEGWINTEPLTLAGLKGKVVLVDFWTYTCINCIRTFPHTSEWYERYKDNDFVLLGVHSPEFEFEKKKENVKAEVEKYGIEYPVALDNEHKTWNAFANRYWPAHYLIDVEGNIRYRHFGEGRYAETEAAIQQLLLEAGILSIDKIVEIAEPPSGVEFQKIGTPEIYLGYLRINNLGNRDVDVRPDMPHTFEEPSDIVPNRFYFVGQWTLRGEFAELTDATDPPSLKSYGEAGKLIIRYKANKINMVLDTKDGDAVGAELKLDGEYLTEKNKGAHVRIENGVSRATINGPGFYNFVDTGGDYDWHTLEIILDSPGLRAFTFTFG